MHATLTSKGQITLPKAVRERLGVQKGDRLVFKFAESGTLQVEAETKKRPLQGFIGLLSHLAPSKPVTVEEMNEAIRERMRRDPFL